MLKTLRFEWNPIIDIFHFKVTQIKKKTFSPKTLTKRQVLSDIRRIFDPLGRLPPKLIKLKNLMQRAWLAKLEWGEGLLADMAEKFLEVRSKMSELRDINFNRLVLKTKQSDLTDFQIFYDLSETVYGAAIYLIAPDKPDWQTTLLLTAKAKEAPLKVQLIPRLELCAALLGSKLKKHCLRKSQPDGFENQAPIRPDGCTKNIQLAGS